MGGRSAEIRGCEGGKECVESIVPELEGVRLLRGGVRLISRVYSLLEGSVDYWLWGGYSLWWGVHLLSLVDY